MKKQSTKIKELKNKIKNKSRRNNTAIVACTYNEEQHVLYVI